MYIYIYIYIYMHAYIHTYIILPQVLKTTIGNRVSPASLTTPQELRRLCEALDGSPAPIERCSRLFKDGCGAWSPHAVYPCSYHEGLAATDIWATLVFLFSDGPGSGPRHPPGLQRLEPDSPPGIQPHGGEGPHYQLHLSTTGRPASGHFMPGTPCYAMQLVDSIQQPDDERKVQAMMSGQCWTRGACF